MCLSTRALSSLMRGARSRLRSPAAGILQPRSGGHRLGWSLEPCPSAPQNVVLDPVAADGLSCDRRVCSSAIVRTEKDVAPRSAWRRSQGFSAALAARSSPTWREVLGALPGRRYQVLCSLKMRYPGGTNTCRVCQAAKIEPGVSRVRSLRTGVRSMAVWRGQRRGACCTRCVHEAAWPGTRVSFSGGFGAVAVVAAHIVKSGADSR